MKKKEMKDMILQGLADILSQTDFQLKKSEDAFFRKIPGGKQMLGLPLWDYNPQFEFSLNICIRLDAAEEIFHEVSGTPPKYRSMSFTTNTPFGRFTKGPTNFKVITAEEVAAAARLLSPVIRERIIPFFDEYKDVKELDRGVNCQEPGIDSTHFPWRAMHSIILAHLAGNKDFDDLVAKHRSTMQLSPETDHPFNKMVEYLKIHSERLKQ